MNIENILNDSKLVELIEKYSFKKFNNSPLTSTMEFSDFLQIIYIKLMKNIKKFDSSKCNIKTYICLIINSSYKCELRRIFSQKNNITIEKVSLDYDISNSDGRENSYHDIISSSFDIDNELNKTNEEIFLSSYYVYLEKEIDKQVLRLLYEGYSQKEIREILKTTRSIIDKSVARIRKKLSLNLKLVL